MREGLDALIWSDHLEKLNGPRRWGLTIARMAYVLTRDLAAGQITMRAMGLVYTSLLSLVPLLALAFSLLKAFGMDNAVRPMLERFLAPLGERAEPLVDTISGFVSNVQVGVLGAVGLVVLLYSVISLIQKIEIGCNAIWEVRNSRSIGRRFTEYLSVLIVGPLVVVAATSITASLSSTTVVTYLSGASGFGAILYIGGYLMPYVMYGAAFTVLYAFMPNTHVRPLAALGGGLLAGTLWQTASLLFTTFAANAGNVNAIYSGFAILILLLIWLYVSWLIMLIGCRVAFLLQHQEQLTQAPYPPPLNSYLREELALLVSTLVAHRFLHGESLWQADELAYHLHVPPSHVYEVVDQLVAGKILIETDHIMVKLLPRQDIAELEVNDIIKAVRGAVVEEMNLPEENEQHRERVLTLLRQAEIARRTALGTLTLRQLAITDADVELIHPRTDDHDAANINLQVDSDTDPSRNLTGSGL